MSPRSPGSVERSEPQVLDLRGAVDRFGGDRQLLRELAEIFLADKAALLNELQGALAENDRQRTVRFAHNLKGIAANIGGGRVHAAAHFVEEAARSGNLDLARLAVDPLTAELERLADALRRTVLSERPASAT